VAEKRCETHFLSNEEKEKWIEDYVERETAGARKRVEDAEAAVQQEQDEMVHAEITGLTSREPEKTFEEMMAALGDSLRDLASSDTMQDGEDEDEETEQTKLSEDDKPGWLMSTITKMVQQPIESISNNPGFRLKHPGVPDSSDGSDGTSYPLTENYTLPVAQATGRVAQHSTWERRGQTCERLGAPQITVEHSGKNNIWERCWCAWNS